MLVKWILCQVSDQALFSRGQREWSALREVPGFLGQTGGWVQSPSTGPYPLAAIVGLWNDNESYRVFMRDSHDPIFDRSHQRSSLIDTKISLAFVEGHLAGSRSTSLVHSLDEAHFIRVANCRIHSKRESSFLRAQEDVWGPGMKKAGMVGGLFCRCLDDSERFLVITGWPDERVHEEYQANTFPELSNAAGIDRDIVSVSGHRILAEPSFRLILEGGS